MIWGLSSIYFLFSTIFVGLGIHAYGNAIFDSMTEISEKASSEGPQEVVNLMGIDLEYKPLIDDWPNVVDPHLQYWPRKNTFR